MSIADWDRDNCAVGNTLAVIGERWTLLVLREAFLGVRRFDQFQRNTGMARNILSDRLNTLVAHGILRRELYQERPAALRVPPDREGPRPLSRPDHADGLGPRHAWRSEARR